MSPRRRADRRQGAGARSQTDAVDRSSHWRSSTAIRIGRSAIAARRAPGSRGPVRDDLAAPSSRAVRPSAGSSTFRCQSGRVGPYSSIYVAEEIAQRRQAHLLFGLRAHRAQDTAAPCAPRLDRVLEQASLADPGFALDDQAPGLRSDRAYERLDRLELALSTADQRLFGQRRRGGFPGVPMLIVSGSPQARQRNRMADRTPAGRVEFQVSAPTTS